MRGCGVADKLTQQIVEAVSKAATEPLGLPLFASKSETGLFAAGAKAAAQKCVADKLIQVVRTETKGKTPREFFAATEAGWEFLSAAVNPKQVLEDFVRVLEARQGVADELLSVARQMAESLQGLKDAVSRVLPQVTVNRIKAPSPPANLEAAILDDLADWFAGANAGEDCPLPELFHGIARSRSVSLGEFHDCLRKLQAAGSVYLHSWTGPLYELPDPAVALLIGHGIAYYASLRNRKESGARQQEPERSLAPVF